MRRGWYFAVLILLALASPVLHAEATISIIIDDMGYRLALGRRAVNLPGVMTYAFLPHAPHSKYLAQKVHEQHKQVMLHQPMTAESHRNMGPGGLDEGMNAVQLARVLAGNLASVPYVEGINNHMGSLLTQQKSMMDLFMHALAKRGRLFFIDSRTTSASVALIEARENGIASTSRDVFLDDDRSPALINHQLDILVSKAQRKGYALAIGHPYPETLQVLETRLPQLHERGIQMVKASVYIADKYQKRFLWQASLSPSPRVVKN